MTPPFVPQTHARPRIYPPYLHALSPTVSRWAPLCANDLHALRTHGIYNASLLSKDKLVWHWGNHPVQWVRVVGVVVGIDDFGISGEAIGGSNAANGNGDVNVNVNANPNGNGRRVLTLDDSSGACIECCAMVPATSDSVLKGSGRRQDQAGMSKHLEQLEALKNGLTAGQVAGTKTTQLPTLQTPAVMWRDIDIGSVVKIKGVPGQFRDMIQIHVIKIDVVRSTDEEVRCWVEVDRFRRDVLDVPWVVGKDDEERARRRHERSGQREGEKKRKGQERNQMQRHRSGKDQEEDMDKVTKETQRSREQEAPHSKQKKRNHESAGLDSKNMINYPTLATRRRLAGKYPALGI